MSMLRTVTALAAGFVAVAACTTLDVRPVEPARGPTPDWTYYQLPYTRYDITITRRVSGCTRTQIEIATTTSAVASLHDDPRQIYEINRDSLRQLLNTAKLTTTFQHDADNQRINNRLLTINATIDDQTLPALNHLITGIGKFAAVSAGVGGHSRTNETACNDLTLAALNAAPTQVQTVKDAAGAVEALTAEITQLRADRAAQGISEENADGDLALKLAERRAAIARLATAQRTLDTTLGSITATDTRTWPDDGETFATAAPFRLSPTVFHGWQQAGDTTPQERELEHLAVSARIERSGEFGRDPVAERASPPSTSRLPRGGIRYRVPVPGDLVTCLGTTCDAGAATAPVEVGRHPGPVSQLGYLQTIPVRARFLENVQFSATFSTNGAPSSIGYESTGGGTRLAETVSGALTQGAAVRQAEITYEQGAGARRLAALQQEAQMLQLQAQIAAANSATVQETLAINTQLARVLAEIALLEAQNRRTALTAPQP